MNLETYIYRERELEVTPVRERIRNSAQHVPGNGLRIDVVWQ